MAVSVLERLFGQSKSEIPRYSRLRADSRPLPRALIEAEASETFCARGAALQAQLLELPYRPPEDEPLFVTLVARSTRAGVLLIDLPDGSRCLPIFTTPFKAADYVETLGARGRFEYLVGSPAEAFTMLGDLVGMLGLQSFVLDRCPRCAAFASTATRSLESPAHLLVSWSIFKGLELVRADLYFAYALQSARVGALERARDVALEAAGHVTFEDARVHLLLGQLAVALRDRRLLGEARAFLGRLGAAGCEQKLDDVERTGQPDFDGPAWPIPHPQNYPTSGWTSRLTARDGS